MKNTENFDCVPADPIKDQILTIDKLPHVLVRSAAHWPHARLGAQQLAPTVETNKQLGRSFWAVLRNMPPDVDKVSVCAP